MSVARHALVGPWLAGNCDLSTAAHRVGRELWNLFYNSYWVVPASVASKLFVLDSYLYMRLEQRGLIHSLNFLGWPGISGAEAMFCQ